MMYGILGTIGIAAFVIVGIACIIYIYVVAQGFKH